MKIRIYQVDAFAKEIFKGNPAAVCPLEGWLPDEVMQRIALENNLAETAFFVQTGDRFHIRWFTPEVEVDLCGHATLASAFVIYNHLDYQQEVIHFDSRGGELTVSRQGDLLSLNFPVASYQLVTCPAKLLEAFNGLKPVETYQGMDYMLVFNNEREIKYLHPNLEYLRQVRTRGVIVTAKGDNVDFVSRFFAPLYGINEDPVTGSAHTMLIPYWANQLGKNEMKAVQLSKRGGELDCMLAGNRVEIGGQAVLYMIGEIFI